MSLKLSRIVLVLTLVVSMSVAAELVVSTSAFATVTSTTVVTAVHHACQSEAEPGNTAAVQVQQCFTNRANVIASIKKQSHGTYTIWATLWLNRTTGGGLPPRGSGPYLYLWSKYRKPCDHPDLHMPRILHMPAGFNDAISFARSTSACESIAFFRDSKLSGPHKWRVTGITDLVALGFNDRTTSIGIYTDWVKIVKT